MKQFLTIFLTAIISLYSAYFALDLKEEKLVFSLDPANLFGGVIDQGLKVRNTGWDPATNVLLSVVNRSDITSKNVKATSGRPYTGKENAIWIFERIRRNEDITLSFSFKGNPIAPPDILVKSDRTVGELMGKSDWSFNWPTFFMGAGFGFSVSLLLYLLRMASQKRAHDRQLSDEKRALRSDWSRSPNTR